MKICEGGISSIAVCYFLLRDIFQICFIPLW